MALVASAGTVIVGLGMLFFSRFAKVKYTGPTIALSLSVALLAALTLAPAVLIVLRRAIFWPLRSPRKAAGTDASLEESNTGAFTGFWAGIADLVVTYPLLILSVCLLVLRRWRLSGLEQRRTITN